MYVYVLGGFNLRDQLKAVKIGVTENIEQRVRHLQTAQILEIKPIAAWHTKSRMQAFAAEADMHRQYERAQMRGEWFRPHIVQSLMYRLNKRMAKMPCLVTGHGSGEYLAAAKNAARSKSERGSAAVTDESEEGPVVS